MARVRTSVSLGTVAVLVLGGLSLGLGSVTMPSSTTLGGPVVLSARPDLQRPLIATPDGTTDPGTTGIEGAAVEPVGVRAPTPIRAEALRTATNGTGSHHDSSDTSGTTGTATTRTAGADGRASTESTVQTPDVRATGTVTTSGSVPVEPTHAPSAPSRSDEMRSALVSPIELTTSGTSTPEGTRTHVQP
ncbi:hypothetical protein GALL_378040 [mine drainage metagenome]|uniref:Uncharacterized protein n=1 Tax=mine drainage metagenome TaxID=410659 RepID=A0A1J5Q9W5_9ZZZZ